MGEISLIIKYHMISTAVGFLLDFFLGDPQGFPHPVRLVGAEIAFLDKKWNKGNRRRSKGSLLVFVVLLTTIVTSMSLIILSYTLSPLGGIIVESILTWQILAMKSLKTESMKVYRELQRKDLEKARHAVSYIVGRDTDTLSESGVAKAAVETVAENTSDGVIAPMLYTALGGVVLGAVYKAINTMDSMIGYKNETYLEFGKTAAKLDDAVNFIPSRLSACFMILSCYFTVHDYDGKRAFQIFLRDRFCHASPNSAQTEAVCAGALGIQLAGDASYFGKKVSKPFIGDAIREIETEDIRRVNRLMYTSAFLCELLCLLCMGGMMIWLS